MARIAFDTPPFIYFLENHPRFSGSARVWFEQVIFGTDEAVCSVLVLTEILTGLRKQRNTVGEATAQAFLLETPGLTVVDVSQAIADRAATLRARYGLRTPDALHLATALESKATQFITADRKLGRIPGITVKLLKEMPFGDSPE